MKRLVPLTRVLGLALAAGTAFAQPANDLCTAAEDLSSRSFPFLTTPVDISTAALAAEVPTCGLMSNTVWYKLVANDNGTIDMATCLADAPDNTVFDTVLSIFESADGTCGTLTQLACIDDACDGLKSRLSVSCTSGVTYYLQVGIFNGPAAPGASIQFSINAPVDRTVPGGIGAASPNPIDNCAASTSVLFTVAAIPVESPPSTGITVSGNLSNVGGSATQQFFDDGSNGDVTAGDLTFSYRHSVPGGTPTGAPAIPFTVTDAQSRTGNGSIGLSIIECPPPTGSGQAFPDRIDNCADVQVQFDVATVPGNLPAATVTIDLSAIGGSSTQAMSDPEADGTFSVLYTVPAGTVASAYNLGFTVADSLGRSSAGNLAFTVAQCPPPPAANDFCTDAIDVSANTAPFTTDPVAIAGCELAPEAPMCAFNPSQTVWYKLRAAVGGELRVSTCAAEAPATNIGDTVLAIYASDDGSCDTLTSLTCVDDSCGLRTIVTTNTTAGTWYYIQAAKYNGAATPGLDSMQLHITPPAPPPPGSWVEADDAGDLPADAQTPVGSGPLSEIRGATNNGGNADMYLIDICSSEEFRATTVGGTTIDTQLFLFNLDGTGVTHNDDSTGLQSTITNTFLTTGGQYYLAISGYNNDPNDGDGQLIWENLPLNVERAPDGPGAAGAVGSWTGTGAGGNYRIALTGVCFPGGGCDPCPADYNQDGGVDGGDVESFFLDWEESAGCSDTNQDGGIDGADVEAFFVAWEAGGC